MPKPIEIEKKESIDELSQKLQILFDDIYKKFDSIDRNVFNFTIDELIPQQAIISIDSDAADAVITEHEATYNHALLHTQNTDTQLGSGLVNVGSGSVVLTGTAIVWKSSDLKPANVGLPVSNPPAADEYQGFPFQRYNRATEEQVYYIWTVPEDFYSSDASLKYSFGFFIENPPSGADENVRMGIEYKKITSDTDVLSFSGGTSTGYVDETIADGESAYLWHKTAYGACVTTGWAYGDVILFRFYRDATAPEDTYDNEVAPDDNDVWVGIYHIEYQSNKLGG